MDVVVFKEIKGVLSCILDKRESTQQESFELFSQEVTNWFSFIDVFLNWFTCLDLFTF